MLNTIKDKNEEYMRIVSAKDKLQILLLESSPEDATLIEKTLVDALPDAFTLVTVPTLEASLKILDSESFDVILLDRYLPDVDGFTGLHTLQSMAPQLPIVFLASYLDEGVAFEAIKQGAQDYLYKDKIDGHIIKRAMQYAILRKQFEGALILRANFDMLTGLANRMLFESRLEMAIARKNRQGGNVAVLFFDLDRFKQVNDTLGHGAGDILLKEVAIRLKKALRPYDTFARFGGDEFAVLLEAIPAIQHCEIVAKKVINILEEPFSIAGNQVSVGISIGIAGCIQSESISREALMKQADEAMYRAKAIAGSAFAYYTEPSH